MQAAVRLCSGGGYPSRTPRSSGLQLAPLPLPGRPLRSDIRLSETVTKSENNVAAVRTCRTSTHHGKNNLNANADTTAFTDTWLHAADTHASADPLGIRRTMPAAALRITLRYAGRVVRCRAGIACGMQELAANDGLDAFVWDSQYCCPPESLCNSRRTTASPWHLADESTRPYLGLAAGCSTSSLTRRAHARHWSDRPLLLRIAGPVAWPRRNPCFIRQLGSGTIRAFGCPPHRELVSRTAQSTLASQSIPTTEDNHK